MTCDRLWAHEQLKEHGWEVCFECMAELNEPVRIAFTSDAIQDFSERAEG